ncbi:unnamed protein product [Parnassius mnemosyne]|uniref:G-protein coupled receptors family 1 profile domain-containing protein n=1 Tax=Parnassius mnemosyne TaxID=213953 RepID=A0AAV1KIS6_9NEOP
MTLYLEKFNDTVVETYEEFPLLMPRWGYVASAFVLFIIGFFGFFLNLLVILLMFKDRQLWTPLNIILFNLVCSDFSVSVLGNPFTLISALFHRWIFGHTMCVLYGFFMSLLGITSITTLTVISFERYLMVTRALSSRHLTSNGAAMSVVFIWVYALALTTPPLFGWGNYVNEAANISCSVNWHEQSLNTLTYILFLFAMGQIFPFTIITYSYVNIIRTMRKNSRRLGRVNRAEARATAMIFIMIISFTIAWTPYSLFALMEQFATKSIVSPGAGVIPALVAKSSICYDPLIYVGMNTQFRQSIKRIFGIHAKGSSSQIERGKSTVLSTSKITNIVKRNEKNCECTDDQSDEVKNVITNKKFNNKLELFTIEERKTVSDAERSGETYYDDESSSANKKIVALRNSCKLNDASPILSITDTEKPTSIFTKAYDHDRNDTNDLLKNVYTNKGFEEHSTGLVKTDELIRTLKRPNTIKHSFSLDLGGTSNEGKRRKFSMETKLESIATPKSFIDIVVSKLFDPEYTQDSIKTYFCTSEENEKDEANM